MEIQSIKLLKVLHVALSDRKRKIQDHISETQKLFINSDKNGDKPPDYLIFEEIVQMHEKEIKMINELIGGIDNEISKSDNNYASS